MLIGMARSKHRQLRWLPICLLVCAIGISLPSAAEHSWWHTASAPYRGTTLHGVTEDQPASRYIAEVLAPAFEKETGIHVEIEVVPWQTMADNSLRDMALGAGFYDFVYIEQDIIYSYLAQDYLLDLTTYFGDHGNIVSPDFDFADFTSYLDYFRAPDTRHVYGVPIESFLRVYVYRQDLFADEDIRAAFAKQYGYPLQPAGSITQFEDIAVFFTEWGKQKHIDLWSTTVHAAPNHAASFYELFETVMPMFGVYNWGIDPTTGKASSTEGGSLDGEAAKAALTFWIGLLRYAPPEAFGSTWTDGPITIASGRVAEGFLYGEYMVDVAAGKSKSKVAGNIKVALPPLRPGVLESAKAGDGYIGYYDGGAFGIPKTSRKPEAVALWLQYLGQPSVQVPWTLATGRVTHTATLDDPRVLEMDEQLGGYFRLMKRYGDLFAGAPPFPEHAALREVIAPFVSRALRRQLSPAEALDQAAKAVDSILAAIH